MFSQRNADRQCGILAHPEVLVLEIAEASQQQHCPGKQDHTGGNLRNHQPLTERRMGNECEASIQRLSVRLLQRRRQAKQCTAHNRKQDGEADDA